MIKFISADDVLPIRNEVLREGKLTPHECRFPNDDADTSFHLGYYINNNLVCIASFHPVEYKDFKGNAYQLRGMATTEEYRGKGYGNMLVNFAITYLRGQKVNYLWCNARKKAVPFYLGTGFEIVSPEFDVPGIGPHYIMYVKIT
ncbi:GCN5 family acetyltransferase [Mucilaginibacter sp. PAMC 26640]|nr:GCN5 family acetyltransferase [Mucilaginibacter sp. PAMC 26640]